MRYEAAQPKHIQFIRNIATIFKQSEHPVIFAERNIVKTISHDGQHYAVKSFKTPNFINRITYRFFRKSKARRSFEYAMQLVEANINTPAPLGYLENITPLRLLDSYYICNFIEGAFEVRAVLADKNYPDRERILTEVCRFAMTLHDNNFYHVDFSPGNVIIQSSDAGYRLFLVDVNRMKTLPLNLEKRMENLGKLTACKQDNHLIAMQYAALARLNPSTCALALNNAVDAHQARIRRKKRFKAFIANIRHKN